MIKSSFVVANATVTNVVYQYGVKVPVLQRYNNLFWNARLKA